MLLYIRADDKSVFLLLSCFSVCWRKLLMLNCYNTIDWFTLTLSWAPTVDFYHPLDIYQWSQPRIIIETRGGDEEKE